MRSLRILLMGAVSAALLISPAWAKGHGSDHSRARWERNDHDRDDFRRHDRDYHFRRSKYRDNDHDRDDLRRGRNHRFWRTGYGDNDHDRNRRRADAGRWYGDENGLRHSAHKGWNKGHKTGWRSNCANLPPGQAKKDPYCSAAQYHGRGRSNYHPMPHHPNGRRNDHDADDRR